MAQDKTDQGSSSPPAKAGSGNVREDRLKAALKANLARRKKQARARADKDSDTAKG